MSSEVSFPLSFPTADPLLTITHPQQEIWIVELHDGQDSRLTTRMIDEALRPALDMVERSWCAMRDKQANDGTNKRGGALIIVGRRDQDKFFSNGFDYETVKGNLSFFNDTANPLFARLLTYPIPTIAAINGHAFAAGMMLSLACDYRVMTDGSRRRAWMCMNEIHFGAPWPLSFTAILNAKVGSPVMRRRVALEGHRFTPSEALKAGIVDRLANLTGTSVENGTDKVLEEAMKLANEVKILASQGVWSAINTCLYKDCLEVLYSDARVHMISPNREAKL
ncbi:ClpP/crotonase-like domain-containing protein [Suillus clintonianus]|uniref:ClpP/crotonase-like domain-containing protein n=1 Tax=Suillus clintonianus TaxID=1904413 RepID=UPI001B87F79C|nr:ClpP/crotonase-like domain-containing protein [Suillus clintonianus]KAG2147662.1 ClpP/crotonase-like domain-containing protein [Suillus clintonianus]